ncbi:fluoride efflux transporter FluC [Campylobacter upsaliensis]|uniref:fluoride efflux transporter FluC n=1 Tax=Campylobacter upsaliensis TaxID=28080 RepID=UPI003530422F
MRGDDKGARFFAVCISCRWCVGGFSTFSTFSLEVLKLLQNHFIFTAMLYMLLSNVCGILCVSRLFV